MDLKHIYIVDCENTGNSRLKPDTDNYIIYYFTSVDNIKTNLASNEYVELVEHTKCLNALDFIIASKLGYLIQHYERNAEYYIVSNDKGFDNLVSYWGSLGYSVFRCSLLNVNRTSRLHAEYLFNTLSSKKRKHVRNVYKTWINTKAKDFGILRYQLSRTLDNCMCLSDFEEFCEYIFENGLKF